MSFDLLVLYKKVNSDTQSFWIEKLKKRGVEAQFPRDYFVGISHVSEVNIRYRLTPPLVEQATEFKSIQFNLNHSSIDKEVMEDYLDFADSSFDLKNEISAMKSELQLSTNSGRSDNGLVLQCYLAATLTDVTNGILFDPQEFGAMKEKDAYKVAQYHTKYVFKKHVSVTKKENNAGKSQTIIYLLLVFILLLQLVIDKNLF